MTTEPTIAELVRQLAAITAQLDRIAQRLETDYVRRDLYMAQMQVLTEKIDELKERADRSDTQRASDRRLIITAFVAPIITALIVLYVSAQVGGR